MQYLRDSADSELHLIIVGAPKSGKSSLVKLLGGKSKQQHSGSDLGVTLGRFEVPDSSMGVSVKVTTWEFSDTDLDYLESICLKNNQVFVDAILIINLELSTSKLNAIKKFQKIQKIFQKFEQIATSLPETQGFEISKRFMKFNELMMPETAYRFPSIIALNKFDQYFESDMFVY